MNKYRNNNFDLLRLYAAISVLFNHALHHLYEDYNISIPIILEKIHYLISYIHGVPIFFLISGYLIYMSYDKNSKLIDYTKNRVLRIYPALLVNLLISVFILSYFGFVKYNFDFLKWLLAQATIFQFYNAEMFRGFGVGVINGSLWTVSVELTFYILLPLLVLFYNKRESTIVLIFLISFGLWYYDNFSNKSIFINKLIHTTIPPYLFLFIIGMTFYKYHNKIIKYIENKFVLYFVLFIIYNIIISLLNIKLNFLVLFFKWIIFSFMIFSFAFSNRNLSNSILKGNDYTYGIYIYHMLVINIFVYFQLNGKITYIIYVIFISILLGILSWHIIEKPFLKLKNHSLFNSRIK